MKLGSSRCEHASAGSEPHATISDLKQASIPREGTHRAYLGVFITGRSPQYYVLIRTPVSPLCWFYTARTQSVERRLEQSMSDHATETSTLLNEAVSSLDASGDASVEAPLPMAVCGTDIMQAGRSSACACIPRLSKRRCASIGTSCVVLLLMLAVGVRLWSQAVGDERFARRWCYSHYKGAL